MKPDKKKIIEIFSGDIEGHKAANNKALLEAIINPEHGYYVKKNKEKYEVIMIKEAKKFEL